METAEIITWPRLTGIDFWGGSQNKSFLLRAHESIPHLPKWIYSIFKNRSTLIPILQKLSGPANLPSGHYKTYSNDSNDLKMALGDSWGLTKYGPSKKNDTLTGSFWSYSPKFDRDLAEIDLAGRFWPLAVIRPIPMIRTIWNLL